MIRNNKEVGKVGFVASAFDLLHAGHVKMLEDAKEQCDYLIAALQSDPTIDKNYRDEEKNKPVQTLTERQIMIESIRYIDEVIIYETENDLYNLLWDINPAISHVKPSVLKWVIFFIPDSQFNKLYHVSSLLLPIDESKPKPVTTTRFI